jgi:hypothetical protein
MHRDSSLPQTPPGSSHGLGLIPASPLADGGRSRLALEVTLSQIIPRREGAVANPTCTCDAGPGSRRGFPQFEHGAGIYWLQHG